MTQDTTFVVPLILKTTLLLIKNSCTPDLQTSARSFCMMAPVHIYPANVDLYLQHAPHLNGSVYSS